MSNDVVSDRTLVCLALSVYGAAWIGWGVSLWIVAAFLAVGILKRWTAALFIALVVFSSSMSARSDAGINLGPAVCDVEPESCLNANSKSTLAGWATLVTDPQSEVGGVSLRVSLNGRRYQTFAATDDAAILGGALVGDRVWLVGRPVELSGSRSWMRSVHLAGRLRVSEVGEVRTGAIWWRMANGLRRTVEAGLGDFSSDEASLFTGVVYGDDRGQSELTKHRFRVAGLSHLLAVSGQNVAFILIIASPFLNRQKMGIRWLLTLVLLGGFVLVTRFEPSVLRAVAMAFIAASAAWKGRELSGLRIVSIAVIGLILLDPLLVYSVGFQLSVAATVALVVLAAPMAEAMGGPRVVSLPFAVSVAAQAGTAPLLAGYFGVVPLLSPFTNVLGGILGGWLMMWGVISAPLAGLGDAALAWLNAPSLWIVKSLAKLAEVAATPGVPMVGLLGSLVMLVLPVWIRARADDRPEPRESHLANVALAVVVVLWGLGWAQGRDNIDVENRGVRLVVADDRAVMEVDHPARSSDAFRLVERYGISHIETLLVYGGGRNSKTLVWDIRRGLKVDRIVAVPELQIPGATRMHADAE